MWALWVPSPARDLDMPDDVREVGRLERDTTTLVMQATLRRGSDSHDGVIRTSIAAVTRVCERSSARCRSREPDETPGLSAWVMVQDAVAVACAWSFLHENGLRDLYGRNVAAVATPWLGASSCGARACRCRAPTERGPRLCNRREWGSSSYESLGFEPVGRYEEWISQ